MGAVGLDPAARGDFPSTVAVEEVTPGTVSDPFSTAQTDPSAVPPTPVGAPQPETAPQQPVETPPQAPTQPTTEEETPSAPETPPSTPAQPDEEADPEALARLDTFISEQVQAGVAAQLPTIQSGWDKRIAVERQRAEALENQLKEQQATLREIQLNGLPAEQQEELKRRWDWDDQKKELDDYRTELNSFHDDLDIAALLIDFGEYGVTEEVLRATEPDERETLCLREQNKALQTQIQNGSKQPAAPPRATQPAPQPPAQRTPAGATAVSDVGTGGAPPQPVQPNQGAGRDPMAENISHGWETVNVPRVRTG